MIILYCMTWMIFLWIHIRNKKMFLQLGLFHKNGYQRLKRTLISYGYDYDIRFHLLAIILIFSIIALACYQFEVTLASCIYLILIASYLLPHIMIWMFYHRYEESRFNQFTMFIQNFIAIYKINPKTLTALSECERVIQGETLQLIQSMKQKLLETGLVESCFDILIRYQPHFIICNLSSIVTTIEMYGSLDYLDCLDLIQDDIDDWIEDTYTYKKSQISAKNRMLMLCGLSTIIALFAKNMLSSVSFDTQSTLYQIAIVIFFLTLILTVFMAHHILSDSWIEKEEMIMKGETDGNPS